MPDKTATLSIKENLLRAIRHDHPRWVPLGLENTISILPPVTERPVEAGLDDFGVRWAFEEHSQGGTYPAAGGHVIRDFTRWKEQSKLFVQPPSPVFFLLARDKPPNPLIMAM
jgi:hypothetical protein